MKYIPGAALVNLKDNEEERKTPARIISLRELGEMCANGRIVVAYQVRRPFRWRVVNLKYLRAVCTT